MTPPRFAQLRAWALEAIAAAHIRAACAERAFTGFPAEAGVETSHAKA
jgi:hypothetical protein